MVEAKGEVAFPEKDFDHTLGLWVGGVDGGSGGGGSGGGSGGSSAVNASLPSVCRLAIFSMDYPLDMMTLCTDLSFTTTGCPGIHRRLTSGETTSTTSTVLNGQSLRRFPDCPVGLSTLKQTP
ncbi:hypothetical protein HZH68_012588 [Vespula germanica]|uniref:Uncharacterized protein n=1 Tax=Vespula germanica TaxID=30212 RepID=A0A834JJC7_VESGE|nr:hypothetical protein HZH68_012588 [Vespula germanica]